LHHLLDGGNDSPVRPTARSLILDLLATLRRGAMPVRALVAAGGLFGVSGNSMRVALARLLAAGLVERDERGQYRAGAGASAVGRQIARWRSTEEAHRPWDGGWVGVFGVTRARTDRAGMRALRFLAFRELLPGLHVRPDNLVGGVPAVREQLHGLGLSRDMIVAAVRDLDPAAEARARTLWDVARLRAAYRRTCATLAESERRLARMPAARAMVESFLVGGRVIRQIVLDPMLPEPMVPASERAALIEAMRRYDRIGRACWAGFMREFGVLPEARAPVDLRIVDGAGRLEGAAA
jgi:phenylacetic acid degradation operon negative regulatory protein